MNAFKLVAIFVATLLLATTSQAEPTAKNESPQDYFTAIKTALKTTEPQHPWLESVIIEVKYDLEHRFREKGRVSTGVPFSDCNTPETFFGLSLDDPNTLPVDIIIDTEMLRAYFDYLKMPKNILNPHITHLEKIAIEYISIIQNKPRQARKLRTLYHNKMWDIHQNLLVDANKYGKTQGLLFEYTDGCGGGELPVKINTQPSGAKVHYIPLFFYNLCKARGIPPDDFTACTGWVSAAKKSEYLSGKYFYIAQWPNGKSRSDIFNVEEFEDDLADRNELIQVTINQH